MKVFSIVHGFDTTRVAIVVTSILLVGVGLLTVPLGVMSLTWGLVGALPGLALTWLSLRGFLSKGGDPGLGRSFSRRCYTYRYF